MSEHMAEESIFIRHRCTQLLYWELLITLVKQQGWYCGMRVGTRRE